MMIASISQLTATEKAGDAATLDVNHSAAAKVSGGAPVDLHPEMSQLAAYTQQLYQMKQNDPAQFQAVTAQVSQELTTASQQALQSGQPVVAKGLSDLANQFAHASEGGAVPTPAPPPASGTPPATGGTASPGGSTTGQDPNHLLLKAAFVHNYRSVYGDPVAATLTSILGSVLPPTASS